MALTLLSPVNSQRDISFADLVMYFIKLEISGPIIFEKQIQVTDFFSGTSNNLSCHTNQMPESQNMKLMCK